jgi:hypothetical protein
MGEEWDLTIFDHQNLGLNWGFTKNWDNRNDQQLIFPAGFRSPIFGIPLIDDHAPCTSICHVTWPGLSTSQVLVETRLCVAIWGNLSPQVLPSSSYQFFSRRMMVHGHDMDMMVPRTHGPSTGRGAWMRRLVCLSSSDSPGVLLQQLGASAGMFDGHSHLRALAWLYMGLWNGLWPVIEVGDGFPPKRIPPTFRDVAESRPAE